MKVFLDTNVVIDYLAKRQLFAEDANRMITLCCQREDELCISALSFTTIYYVLKKQYNHLIKSVDTDFVRYMYDQIKWTGRMFGQKQIADTAEGYVVKDDIESGYLNVVPLWAFGLNY